MIDPHFILLGTLFNISATASYILATLKGKTRPNRITWAIWATAPLIAFSAELTEGVGLRSLVTFAAGFGPLLVFGASFLNAKAYWKVDKLDWVCGGLSIVALALWAVTRNGNVAILLSILADSLAALPTIRKAYREPDSEHELAYVLSSIAGIIALLTVKEWTFANFAFPLYLVVCCLIILIVIRFVNQPRFANAIAEPKQNRPSGAQ